MYVWTQQFCSMLMLSKTKLLYSLWKSIMHCWSVASDVAMISRSLFNFCVKCQSCDASVQILKSLQSSIYKDSFSMIILSLMSRLYISNSSNSSLIDFLILIANLDFSQSSQSSNYSLWMHCNDLSDFTH